MTDHAPTAAATAIARPGAADPWIDHVWPASEVTPVMRAVRAALLALVGAQLLWLSAKTQVPFWPVPLTMQPLAVMLLGLAFGWRLAVATVILYLAQGAFGMPVFAGTPARGIGLAYMMGPTGGYLLGFALAAAAIGAIVGRARGATSMAFHISVVLALVAGILAIYVPGYLWLANFVGFAKAWTLGVWPFIVGDVIKAAIAAALAFAVHLRLRRT
ncbi:MAG: biotin transporter BioY [Alphaproteobacteria bacterium]